MALVVKKMDLNAMDSNVGTYTYEADNITLTIRSISNPSFQKAYGMIIDRDRAEKDSLREIPMGDTFLASINMSDKSVEEMIARAIGKFLIVSWDVEVENPETEKPEPLEVTADNFLLVLANISDGLDFGRWCMARATDVAVGNAAEIKDIKKKPSRATGGKKTTKTSPTSKETSDDTSA